MKPRGCVECAGGRYRPRPGEEFILCLRHAASHLYVIDDVQVPRDTFAELLEDAAKVRPPPPSAGVFVRGLPVREPRQVSAAALAWSRPGAEYSS